MVIFGCLILFSHQAETGTTVLESEDHMDDGTPIKLSVNIDVNDGSAIFDFTGTGPEVSDTIFIMRGTLIFNITPVADQW